MFKRSIVSMLILFIIITSLPMAAIASDGAIPSEWAKNDVYTAISRGLTVRQPDGADYYQRIISRLEFCELTMKLLERVKGEDALPSISNRGVFTDTSNESVLAAYELGVVKGKGQNIFDPSGEITRQEAAVMLGRLADLLELNKTDIHVTFTDDGDISSWANEDVYTMTSVYDRRTRSAVITGVEDNMILPLSPLTVEQGIVIMLRMYGAAMYRNPPKQINYIYLNGLLMGTFEGGKWNSRNDGGILRTVSMNEILAQTGFEVYSNDARLGRSTKIGVITEMGVSSGLDDVADLDALRNSASGQDETGFRSIFPLPASLSDSDYYIPAPGYNGQTDFYIEGGVLAISAAFNPLPKAIRHIDTPTDKDLDAVSNELKNMGIPGAPVNIVNIVECDVDGNGVMERIILAETPRGKDGYPYITANEYNNDDSGSYYMVLCLSGDTMLPVIKHCLPYGFKKADIRPDTLPGELRSADHTGRVRLIGIFDLDEDGKYEICLDLPGWEGGSQRVFDLTDKGAWENVLTSFYGT